MKDIVLFRGPEEHELKKVSAQLTESYKAAYKGLMNQVYLDSLSEDYWVPILTETRARGDVCIVAEIDGEIVGTVVYGRSEKRDKEADWHAIYLSPDTIGKGVGHQLYNEMEKSMQEQGYKSCVLEVLTGNDRVVAFYEKHGYSIVDTFEVEENDMKLECYTMRKKLIPDV